MLKNPFPYPACARSFAALLALAIILLLLTGCGGVLTISLETPTAPPAPTLAATDTPVPPTMAATSTTAPSPTTATTDTPSAPTNTAAPTTVPSPTPGAVDTPVAATATTAPTDIPPATRTLFTQVKIFLIALDDNGKSGPAVGCGDSAVEVNRVVAPTNAPLKAALNELLLLHQRDYGQSGLYNALYQSDLQVQSATVANGKATIKLTGKLLMGGECDDPRVEAQLTQTALQFSTVTSVEIFINDTPLKNLLGGR